MNSKAQSSHIRTVPRTMTAYYTCSLLAAFLIMDGASVAARILQDAVEVGDFVWSLGCWTDEIDNRVLSGAFLKADPEMTTEVLPIHTQRMSHNICSRTWWYLRSSLWFLLGFLYSSSRLTWQRTYLPQWEVCRRLFLHFP